MKKSVLFLHHAPNIGGATVSGLNFLNTLDSEVYNITVYCPTSSSSKAKNAFLNSGFKVINGGSSPSSFSHFSGGEYFFISPRVLINIFKILKDFKNINHLIYKEKPDIVIVNSMTLFWIGKIAKKYNTKTICFVRETYAKGLFGLRTSYIKRKISKYFDKVAFISDFDLQQSISLKCRKEVIYNSLNVESYDVLNKFNESTKLGFTNENFYFLFVGGMSKLKGAHIIIKALTKTHAKNIKLIFVGYTWNGKRKKIEDCKNWKQKIRYLLNIDYEKKCLDIIIKNNISEKIKFYKSDENISKFFLVCDALIFPATKPHQARPVFEAGYSKIPVIISDFKNIRETINKDNCFMFQNKNYFDLAEIIDSMSEGKLEVSKKVNGNHLLTIKRHTPGVYYQKVSSFMRD